MNNETKTKKKKKKNTRKLMCTVKIMNIWLKNESNGMETERMVYKTSNGK